MIPKNNTSKIQSEKEILVAELFESISHPTRIHILKLLQKKNLGFAKLKSNLGFSSSGTLSHHLTKLGTLVQTNNQGNYELTDEGREALMTINAFGGLDKNWIKKIALLMNLGMALLFYSTYVTAGIILGYVGDDLSTLLSALTGSIIIFVIGQASFQVYFQKRTTDMKNN